MAYRIGDLAKMTGCKPVTIRYYEKEGLLLAPERTAGNYRLYGERELERLRFVRHCRRHGMELDEIRALLAFRDKPVANCGWINTLVAGRIAKVDEQIAALQHLKEHLQTLLHSCEGDRGGECGILKSLDKGESCPHCTRFACGHTGPAGQTGGSARETDDTKQGVPAGGTLSATGTSETEVSLPVGNGLKA